MPREPHQIGKAVDPHLLKHPRPVDFRRLEADAEFGGEFLGGLAIGQPPEHFLLAGGQ